MSLPDLGEAMALCRTLSRTLDPLDAYAALSDDGRRSDTLLIECKAATSLLVDRAAVRAECRGERVDVVALSDGGLNVLDAIEARMPERIVDRRPDSLVLRFPRLLGDDAAERLKAQSGFDLLRLITIGLASVTPEEPFTIACAGVIAFDHVDLFEDLPPPHEDPLGFPDYLFWLAESAVLFEPGSPPRAVCTAFGGSDPARTARSYHGAAQRLADLVERCGRAAPIEAPVALATSTPARTDLDDQEFAAVVRRMKDHIRRGDIYQIVPSRTFAAPCPQPLAAAAALRQLDPSPYHFFVSAADHLLFGASPETSVRVFEEAGSAMVEVKPIAGTRARGRSADEDDRLEAELRLDGKELAEHMMLVDLARNDVARVSAPGTRRVAKLLTVERYARVMHLVSSVTGRLRPELDPLHALQACLNVGTLSGAPKVRATQLLRETERTKRGPYGGAVGWLNGAGMMDTAVVIRSAVVMDGMAYVRAGAGVVHDSDPILEAEETGRKAGALLSVLGRVRAAA